MEDEGLGAGVKPAVPGAVPAVSVSDLGGEIVQPGEADEVELGVGFGAGYRRARAG